MHHKQMGGAVAAAVSNADALKEVVYEWGRNRVRDHGVGGGAGGSAC